MLNICKKGNNTVWIGKKHLEKKEKSTYNLDNQTRGVNYMRIAICDDEPIHREDVKKVLSTCEVLPKNNVLSEYPNGLDLLEEHAKNPFDIVFLDIEMEGLSGLETGQKIRNIGRNVIIIFLTSYKDYVFNSFRIEPFDYILKPITVEKIINVLKRAVNKYNEQHYLIPISFKDNTYTLEVREIVYIESDLRHVIFYTENNRYMCIGKLNEYDYRLSSYGFYRCHQSYLINMNFIKSIDDKKIEMTTGSEINMSVRRKQDCLNAYSEYLARYRV